MLVSPKWQTMWLESQHCSKNIINMHLPSQQSQRVLEDLRISCCSPNKAVQLEALKCWGIWINNQNPDDWKVNTVCFTAVRPLISKKLQPLYKDVDICKMKLSLMWALLVKVQNLMNLEGPQYILEVFLQSCLTWLFSINGDGCENRISSLIFQLLLGIFKKCEKLSGCDKDLFPPLSTNILLSNKVFHHLADKFLNIFIHWRKVRDKNIILKLWKHFLEHCELSCEHIPIPVWHKIFKLAGQICLEKNESVKERLGFLHSCATTLKSTLSSSKFIDFGNLLTTPCEALFKKLIELCTVESNESCDLEMFTHSKEICQVLSDRCVAVGGFDLCISVLDVLEEFCLRSLFWGVWCGLVYCYKVQLLNVDKNHFTKIQMTFYRKLRGVAVNFELDRETLHEDCITEVEKHIEVLNIGCFCAFGSKIKNTKTKDCSKKLEALEAMNVDTYQPFNIQSLLHPPSKNIIPVPCTPICGKFLTVSMYNKSKIPIKTFTLSFGVIKNILDKIGINSAQPLCNGLFSFRFITLQTGPFKVASSSSMNNFSLLMKPGFEKKGVRSLSLPCIKAKSPPVTCSSANKNSVAVSEKNLGKEVISAPKTRSKKRAEEEEEKKKKMESLRRKKRKSFEVIVQEIVRKNKERKTEKNSERRRSPVMLRGKQSKKKTEVKPEKPEKKKEEKINKPVEVFERKLRNSKKEEPANQKKKEKKLLKTDGKLENYFKVITKKSGSDAKEEEKYSKKKKKAKRKTIESSCCNLEKEEGEKKGEIAWRQTSLKMMMNEKSKADKGKQGLRTRSKATEFVNEKPKTKRENKKLTGSSLAKLSPFKEVLHDHEYAKIQPQDLQTFEKVILAKEKTDEARGLKKYRKSKSEFSDLKKVETQEAKPEGKNLNLSKSKISGSKALGKSKPIMEAKKLKTVEKVDIQNEQEEVVQDSFETNLLHPPMNEKLEDSGDVKKEEEKEESATVRSTPDNHSKNDDVIHLETPEKSKEFASTPSRKVKKRVKMLDSIKPSKKIKLDVEEKLPLEITEKENMEEKQTDLNCLTKKEKNGDSIKNDISPKTLNRMISSRALRMIALVPESTKSSQIQRESPHRAELLKCKKAPNVDKNSRASKMLALLSENVVEVEEVNEFKTEDVSRNKDAATPNLKTPVSSLKSPNSIKKRRSIRFDDAKNETVLYQIDTPPSQILEEKEKCKRIQSNEVTLNLP